MKRTTIFADDEVLTELKEFSKENGRSVAEIVREAIVEFLNKKRQKRKRISLIGIGRSGKKDISVRHEELLWKKHTKGR